MSCKLRLTSVVHFQLPKMAIERTVTSRVAEPHTQETIQTTRQADQGLDFQVMHPVLVVNQAGLIAARSCMLHEQWGATWRRSLSMV